MNFFVKKEAVYCSNLVQNHETPPVCPSILLAADQWNDFESYSQFDVFYHDAEQIGHYIGKVKIIDNKTYTRRFSMHDVLPEKFEKLGDEYCMLGQDAEFYKRLREILPDEFEDVLTSLRDCGTNTQLQECFELCEKWWSLTRDDSAETLLRTASFVIAGEEEPDEYLFPFKGHLPYMNEEEVLEMNFHFSGKGNFARRAYAIIGKNGCGKTQVMKGIPNVVKDIVTGNNVNTFTFGKVISTSNSFYDNSPIPASSPRFNFHYCGLARCSEDGQEKIILSREEQEINIENALNRIQKLGRLKYWYEVVKVLAADDCYHGLISDSQIDIEKFKARFFQSSAGQSSLIYIFTNIISYIRYDSLLLFDEPETHLHPEAVTALMHLIYDLLEDYKSYAIIATHSPMVLREIRSECVYVMERDGREVYARNIQVESLGSSVSCIIDDVFGAMSPIQPYYEKIIENMLKGGMSADAVINQIRNPRNPLSLELKFYIHSMAKCFESSHE